MYTTIYHHTIAENWKYQTLLANVDICSSRQPVEGRKWNKWPEYVSFITWNGKKIENMGNVENHTMPTLTFHPKLQIVFFSSLGMQTFRRLTKQYCWIFSE